MLAPPMVLLEHQPLAAYCNNLLSAFNELRLCAPLSLACDIADQLQASLDTAVTIVLDYHRWVALGVLQCLLHFFLVIEIKIYMIWDN